MFKKDKSIVLVHFGTTYPEAKKKTMDVLEDVIQKKHQEYHVMSAFTSEMVRKIIAKREAPPNNLQECFDKLEESGVKKVALLLTHMLDGIEFRRLQKIARDHQERFDKLTMSRPLLDDEASLERFADVLSNIYPCKEGETKLFVGHGTRLASDHVYRLLNQKLRDIGYQAQISTIEGADTIEKILPSLPSPQETAVEIIPLLYVAGDHAHNDLVENEDSYYQQLKACGYQVSAQIKGLGEWEEIRELYYKNLEDIL